LPDFAHDYMHIAAGAPLSTPGGTAARYGISIRRPGQLPSESA